MMLYLFLFVCLVMIFIEDSKNREVHIIYFLGLFLTSVYSFYIKNNSISSVYPSIFFLIANFSLLKIYMFLAKKKIANELYFGGVAIGDVVFLLVIIPLFSFLNYALFYIIGMCFSLIIHKIVKKRQIDERETVPLAGYLSLFLIGVLFLSILFQFDLYNTIL